MGRLLRNAKLQNFDTEEAAVTFVKELRESVKDKNGEVTASIKYVPGQKTFLLEYAVKYNSKKL